MLDIDDRSANVTAFSGSWRDVDTRLLGPAFIATRPGIIVRHLVLGLNGGRIGLDGTLTPRLDATLNVQDLPADTARLFVPSIDASGLLSATATITGSRSAPTGKLTLTGRTLKLHSGAAAALPPADITASATVTSQNANVDAHLTAGPDLSLSASGLVPLSRTGGINLRLSGRTDLRMLDPFLASQGNVVRGQVAVDLAVTGTPAAPRANGSVTLANGSVENISSGLNLTHISARVGAAGRMVTLQELTATAGTGHISGHGTVDLGGPTIPLNVTIQANNATPISSDIVNETLDADLHLAGALRGRMALGGTVRIIKANINIPQALPPSVANLPIIYPGQKPPPPPPPAPPVALDLTIAAENRIFIRGDGLFAEVGGQLHIGGTADRPQPEGGFDLIRGNISLAGKTLQFTQGRIGFNGAGFMPTLDLEATTVTTNNNTATLIIGGTAAHPKITLTSTPPLPSDEILGATAVRPEHLQPHRLPGRLAGRRAGTALRRRPGRQPSRPGAQRARPGRIIARRQRHRPTFGAGGALRRPGRLCRRQPGHQRPGHAGQRANQPVQRAEAEHIHRHVQHRCGRRQQRRLDLSV